MAGFADLPSLPGLFAALAQRVARLEAQIAGSRSFSRKIDVGSDIMTYTGGAGTKTVAHDLGVSPSVMVATGHTAGGGNTLRTSYSVDSFNASTITFRGLMPSGGGGDIEFYWLAVA